MEGRDTARMTAVVVDDEPMPRRRISHLLSEEGVEVTASCSTGEEALEAVVEYAPDLLFLDIEMPGWDGFETLERIRRKGAAPVVVFVTAHDEHAVQAFEAHALDYVMKPLDRDRFETALARAREEVSRQARSDFGQRVASLLEEAGVAGEELPVPDRPTRPQREPGARTPAGVGDEGPIGDAGADAAPSTGEGTGEASEDGSDLARLVVRNAGELLFIDPQDIDWIEAADNYVRIHCRDASHLVRKTMKEMEEALDRRRFVRIHRSSIVNLHRISSLEPRAHGDYDVVLDDETRLRLSRSRRDALEERIGEHL